MPQALKNASSHKVVSVLTDLSKHLQTTNIKGDLSVDFTRKKSLSELLFRSLLMNITEKVLHLKHFGGPGIVFADTYSHTRFVNYTNEGIQLSDYVQMKVPTQPSALFYHF